MEILIEHFQSYWMYYAIGAAVLLPPLIYFRRWSLPLIQYAVEYVIYMGLIHVGLATIVRVAAWFVDQSTMKRARGLVGQNYNPGWETPWFKFWNPELYNPVWLLYAEIVAAVLVFVLMVRIRGIGAQRKKRKKVPPSKKAAAAGGFQYKAKGGGRR